jgi:two-component system chemotaxis response regulator CheY
MLIQLIQDQAEEKFLKALEEQTQRGVNGCVLFCAFSRISLVADADEILPFLKGILADYEAELYWCRDGDMAICWRGNAKKVTKAIISALSICYKAKLEGVDTKLVFDFYDSHAQGEDLRLLIRKKIKLLPSALEITEKPEAPSSSPPPPPPRSAWKPEFTPDQLVILRAAAKERWTLNKPSVLIVDDQEFFRRLLRGLLGHDYNCYTAANAAQAIDLYAEHAPCLAFLDIELPDGDGHAIASLIKKHDPESFIVMVTGNNYVKDVEMARANKVQGFVAKPYNKLKIMEVVDVFNRKRKR